MESRSDTRKYYLPAISVLQFNILRTPTEILPPSLCNCPSRQRAMCEQTVLILRMLWSQSFDGTWHPHGSLLFHRPVCRHGFMDSLLCPQPSPLIQRLSLTSQGKHTDTTIRGIKNNLTEDVPTQTTAKLYCHVDNLRATITRDGKEEGRVKNSSQGEKGTQEITRPYLSFLQTTNSSLHSQRSLPNSRHRTRYFHRGAKPSFSLTGYKRKISYKLICRQSDANTGRSLRTCLILHGKLSPF